MFHYRQGRFEGVALVPVGRQKSKANVRIRQRISLQHAADADRSRIRFQLDKVQAKTVRIITLHWSVDDIASRGVGITNALIADIANERRIVEQFENELGVRVRRQLAQS